MPALCLKCGLNLGQYKLITYHYLPVVKHIILYPSFYLSDNQGKLNGYYEK